MPGTGHFTIIYGTIRCRAPEISHNKGNGGRFTKMLFRRPLTHCAMVIPFIIII